MVVRIKEEEMNLGSSSHIYVLAALLMADDATNVNFPFRLIPGSHHRPKGKSLPISEDWGDRRKQIAPELLVELTVKHCKVCTGLHQANPGPPFGRRSSLP